MTPEFTTQLFWLCPVVFVAGFIDAIAGGGGLLTVPAYLLAGLPPVSLLGTNKFVSTLGTLISTGKYMWSGRMHWPAALIGLPATLIGAMYGAHTVTHLDPAIVRSVILVALPIAAILTLLPKPRMLNTHAAATWTTPRLWWTVIPVAVLLGWYDGFFGPGTGTILVLLLYSIVRLPFLQAAAVARFFNLVSNAGALVTFVWNDQVLYRIGLPLAAASIAGHYCGSHLALRRGDGFVRAMLAVSCSLVVVYLLWQ
ncbi:MAG: TSUP family transporter [Deltaproteobacteria bacterium]|nr:TSUP family transporter [Deltaproteobacteria bacterium]